MTDHILLDGAVDDPVLAEHVAEIRRLGKRVISDVIEIGRRFDECKIIVGHGNFRLWLDRIGWSDKTVENFINVYKLSGKFENFSNLDLPLSGLYLLAAPSTPDEARDEVFERARAGEILPVTEIKHAIEAAKNHRPALTRRTPPAAPGNKSKSHMVRNPDPPVSEARVDMVLVSADEIAHKDTRIRELEWELEEKKSWFEIEANKLNGKIARQRRELEDILPSSPFKLEDLGKPQIAPKGKIAVCCSFCGKSQNDVGALIVNDVRKVLICDECVDLCGDLIKQQKANTTGEMKTSDAEVTPPADDRLGIPTFPLRATS